MKIAISSTRPDLDAEVAFQFEECKYLIIIDLENMGFEAIPNRDIAQANDLGPQLAKIIANKGVKVVLTGSVDSKVYQALSAVGLESITGISGIVRVVAHQYRKQLINKFNFHNRSADTEKSFITGDSFYRYTIFATCIILADYIWKMSGC